MNEIHPEDSRREWLAAAGVSSEKEARQRLAKIKSQENPSTARRRWRRLMRFILSFGQDSGVHYEERLAEKGDPDVLHDALEHRKHHREKVRKLNDLEDRDAK